MTGSLRHNALAPRWHFRRANAWYRGAARPSSAAATALFYAQNLLPRLTRAALALKTRFVGAKKEHGARSNTCVCYARGAMPGMRTFRLCALRQRMPCDACSLSTERGSCAAVGTTYVIFTVPLSARVPAGCAACGARRFTSAGSGPWAAHSARNGEASDVCGSGACALVVLLYAERAYLLPLRYAWLGTPTWMALLLNTRCKHARVRFIARRLFGSPSRASVRACARPPLFTALFCLHSASHYPATKLHFLRHFSVYHSYRRWFSSCAHMDLLKHGGKTWRSLRGIRRSILHAHTAPLRYRRSTPQQNARIRRLRRTSTIASGAYAALGGMRAPPALRALPFSRTSLRYRCAQ